MAFSLGLTSLYRRVMEFLNRFSRTTSQITAALLAAIVTSAMPLQTKAEPPSTKIVVLGDSLSAGYLLPPNSGFPEQLSEALAAKGQSVSIVNAGVSGDTSTGGLARLDWAVGPETDALILELGSNDALRGIEPEVTRANLDTILTRMTDRGIKVLIAGMQAPPNMGDDYAADFNIIFENLAEKYDVLLYPFFLDGVAAQPELNLPDGIHPTEAGVAVIVENILPSVEKLIAETQGIQAVIN
jgi:acyl-CoA thioesterase I